MNFFYEEYQLLGSYNLAVQHPQFPNIRACVILYNHVAWNSTHEARDIVLIAEIEKHLGDSSYILDILNIQTDFQNGSKKMLNYG